MLPLQGEVIPGPELVFDKVQYGAPADRSIQVAEDSFVDLLLTPGWPHVIVVLLGAGLLFWLVVRRRRRTAEPI